MASILYISIGQHCSKSICSYQIMKVTTRTRPWLRSLDVFSEFPCWLYQQDLESVLQGHQKPNRFTRLGPKSPKGQNMTVKAIATCSFWKVSSQVVQRVRHEAGSFPSCIPAQMPPTQRCWLNTLKHFRCP